MTVSAATLIKTDIQARTVRDFCRVYGVGKTHVYELIARGALVAVKAGTRTLIDEASALAWYRGLSNPTKFPTKKSRIVANRSGRLQTAISKQEVGAE